MNDQAATVLRGIFLFIITFGLMSYISCADADVGIGINLNYYPSIEGFAVSVDKDFKVSKDMRLSVGVGFLSYDPHTDRYDGENGNDLNYWLNPYPYAFDMDKRSTIPYFSLGVRF